MTRPQLTQALDDAFRARVGLLFATLCDNLGMTGTPPDTAHAYFLNGLNVAIRAHAFATASLPDPS
jgi:hypothetical protein